MDWHMIRELCTSIFLALTVLKLDSKCSLIAYKLRFFVQFCLLRAKNLSCAKFSIKFSLILVVLAFPGLIIAELRDPTQPIGFSASSFDSESGFDDESEGSEFESVETESFTSDGSLRLTSILISERRRLAVVNGKVVRLGDKIGDIKVIDIKPGKVLLKTRTGHEILSLSKTKRDKPFITKLTSNQPHQ